MPDEAKTNCLTDINGNITDTLKYDAYGNVTEHIGSSFIIFGYNGRDGVITDRNGLLYMRARYYSPAIRRFINSDILHGEISDSTSLNRYSYVNGNPVSFVDPFGLWSLKGVWNSVKSWVKEKVIKPVVKGMIERIVIPIADKIYKTQKNFKDLENTALYLESEFISYDSTFSNNTDVTDYTGGIIDRQDAEYFDTLKIGNETMHKAGCEAIAVVVALNVILEFVATAVDVFCLQTELVELSGSLGVLDRDCLREKSK